MVRWDTRVAADLVFFISRHRSVSGVCLPQMDKYLWEHVQIFLDRDDLLCLRETSQFHATCEWYGPGWTVILSPLVHILRRTSWDQDEF